MFGLLLVIIVSVAGWLFSLEQPKRSAYLGDSVSQYNLALNYFNEDDYPNAFKWAEKAATKDNADAQNMLCAFYYQGEGVEQDYSKAFEWCEKSANQGNANGQNALGVLYYEGKAVERDYAQAFDLYKIGAYRGDNTSQLQLCEMYAKGKGVRQDYSRAFEWCEKSANQGNIKASFNLALMYLRGNGVEPDVDIATELFGKACDNRIQEGCDEYKRLNTLKAQSVYYVIPSKSYQPEEVYVTLNEEEFKEAELKEIQREKEESELRDIQIQKEAELRAIQRQKQTEIDEAEYRSDLAEIEAGQAEIRSIMRQAELLD